MSNEHFLSRPGDLSECRFFSELLDRRRSKDFDRRLSGVLDRRLSVLLDCRFSGVLDRRLSGEWVFLFSDLLSGDRAGLRALGLHSLENLETGFPVQDLSSVPLISSCTSVFVSKVP